MACAATMGGTDDGAAARFDRLVELHKEVQAIEDRLVTLRAELEVLEDDPLDEADVLSALERFEPVWNSLRTHQQTRMVNLLVERVGYDGRTGKVTVAFRSQGMRELCSGWTVE
jgi:site-specific DNA recombinase